MASNAESDGWGSESDDDVIDDVINNDDIIDDVTNANQRLNYGAQQQKDFSDPIYDDDISEFENEVLLSVTPYFACGYGADPKTSNLCHVN